MRKALFAFAAVAALCLVGALPSEANAQWWRSRGYYYPRSYSSYYYPGYSSYYYYPDYSSYYDYPAYSSYYYDPGYTTYYYSSAPAYDYGYYYYPRRAWRGWRWRY
jgi:hypothetical protein